MTDHDVDCTGANPPAITCTGDPNRDETVVKFNVAVVVRIGSEDMLNNELTGAGLANAFASTGKDYLEAGYDADVAYSTTITEEAPA